ncbi:hypothetical protein Tco_1253477 [Tanacetum coccineum]
MCLSCKVFGHVLDEYPNKIILDVVKNLNNPRQTTRGVMVGPKVSFKSTKQIYRHVTNKNGANTSGKKKQAKMPRQDISNSKPFGVHNSITDDDVLERINKIERQMIEGKLLLADDDGKLLPKVVSTINANSDNEVEEVFDEHSTFMASTGLKCGSDSGYSTNSLWEQWKEARRDDDYDSYDDDLYDSQDMSDNLQAICDELDIMFRGRK